MKKISFFSIFLLIFSFSIIIFEKPVYAELENYSITISCSVSGFDQVTNTLTADYSNIDTITFTASATPIVEPEQEDILIYEWQDTSRNSISQKNELVLKKELSNDKTNLIKIGDGILYILSVKNQTNNQTKEVVVHLNITDINNSLSLLTTTSSDIPKEVTSDTNNIDFYSSLPIKSTHSIGWYIKYPTNTSYKLISNDSKYSFKPSSVINAHGYGEYKIISIGQTKSPANSYYSKTYTINAQPNADFISNYGGAGTIKILSKKIENSVAKIEAFEYTLSDTSNMEFGKIHWYVNKIKVAIGDKFIYEPTTTDTYTVSVTYEDGSINLASINQSPKTTDTYILILSIVGVVMLLSSILAISIIISNKKRDVVW